MRLKKTLMTLILFSSTLFAVEIHTLKEAIDIAGKQRMFSQKMLKNYAMIGMGNSFKNSHKDLEEMIKAFNSGIEVLSQYSKNITILKNLQKIKKVWVSTQKILLQKPKKEKVSQLQEELEKLLHQADKITKLFVASSNASSNNIVNISGRQRMFSQRMASLYMLKVWRVKDPKFQEKLTKTMKLFKSSLSLLKKSKLNTPQINKLLKKVSRSFMFFEFMGRKNSKFVPTLIYKKSNDILKNMEEITALYVALLNK